MARPRRSCCRSVGAQAAHARGAAPDREAGVPARGRPAACERRNRAAQARVLEQASAHWLRLRGFAHGRRPRRPAARARQPRPRVAHDHEPVPARTTTGGIARRRRSTGSGGRRHPPARRVTSISTRPPSARAPRPVITGPPVMPLRPAIARRRHRGATSTTGAGCGGRTGSTTHADIQRRTGRHQHGERNGSDLDHPGFSLLCRESIRCRRGNVARHAVPRISPLIGRVTRFPANSADAVRRGSSRRLSAAARDQRVERRGRLQVTPFVQVARPQPRPVGDHAAARDRAARQHRDGRLP